MLRWPVVLFDFDGTLADTIPLILASFRHTLAQAEPEPVEETVLRSWIGRPLRDVLEERHPGRADALVASYREHNLAHHDALIAPVAGVPELLDELHRAGARTGIISSKLSSTVQRGLDVLGLAGRIEVLAGHEATARHKPHADPLLLAMHRLGVDDPAQCVYVGDTVVDLQAAEAAGMAAVGVTWGAGTTPCLEAHHAAAVVHDTDSLWRTLARVDQARGLAP